MNAHEAAALIAEAAKTMSATVYTPEQWGDRNSDAYAIVPSTGNGVVMVRTDDVIEAWDIVAYVYRTTERVTTADDVMPALMADDGASIDPVSWGAAHVGFAEATAQYVEAAIVDALGKADEAEEAYTLCAEVAVLLPGDLSVDVIPTPDEPFSAVLVSDTSDVATIVRHAGQVSVEGIGDDNDNHLFASVADAVAAILAAR